MSPQNQEVTSDGLNAVVKALRTYPGYVLGKIMQYHEMSELVKELEPTGFYDQLRHGINIDDFKTVDPHFHDPECTFTDSREEKDLRDYFQLPVAEERLKQMERILAIKQRVLGKWLGTA